jgi:hypothetical protein
MEMLIKHLSLSAYNKHSKVGTGVFNMAHLLRYQPRLNYSKPEIVKIIHKGDSMSFKDTYYYKVHSKIT